MKHDKKIIFLIQIMSTRWVFKDTAPMELTQPGFITYRYVILNNLKTDNFELFIDINNPVHSPNRGVIFVVSSIRRGEKMN